MPGFFALFPNFLAAAGLADLSWHHFVEEERNLISVSAFAKPVQIMLIYHTRSIDLRNVDPFSNEKDLILKATPQAVFSIQATDFG